MFATTSSAMRTSYERRRTPRGSVVRSGSPAPNEGSGGAPAAKSVQQCTLGVRGERVLREPAGDRDRLANLLQVGRAAVAAGDVLLEAQPLVPGERALEVIGDELDEFPAAQLFDLLAHVPSSLRYASSAARTFERAR